MHVTCLMGMVTQGQFGWPGKSLEFNYKLVGLFGIVNDLCSQSVREWTKIERIYRFDLCYSTNERNNTCRR